ncbi:hypothetical protein [Nocardioides flavescens]|uniref:Uncharacterized protein n=1 Tax=Nocardioides flavescens TaxID=2691959 RepID=A0A6L7EY39_9ACTN|nr:hypothetical protein [Nocardioides flavescens]MXG89069.1 hypothetical protein [Nocardioides flavescens]
MHDALIYVSLATLALVVVDACVLGAVVAGRLSERRHAARTRTPAPVPAPDHDAPIETVLYVVPIEHDPQALLAALTRAGYPTAVDPIDERTVLVGCPAGVAHRDRLRVVLWREVRRTRTPGAELGPVRFADEG